eukprot:s3800_g4.t1
MSVALLQLLLLEAAAVAAAGAYACVKGHRVASAVLLLCAALLAAFRETAPLSAMVTAVLAVSTYCKYSCICADENNKTLDMARQMKISLMTEEEEALQAVLDKTVTGADSSYLVTFVDVDSATAALQGQVGVYPHAGGSSRPLRVQQFKSQESSSSWFGWRMNVRKGSGTTAAAASVPRLSKKALIFASCRACLTSLSPAYNLLSIVFWACHLLELSMCRCVWLHAKASA